MRPHWKLWLTGTALAAVMLAPDEYLDAAGNLTRAGIEKVAKLGGAVLAGALAGIAQATGEATRQVVRQTAEQVSKTFFGDAWGIVAFALVLSAVVLAVPLTRRCLVELLRRWAGRGKQATASPPPRD